MRKTNGHNTITIHNLTLISQGDCGTVMMNGDNSNNVTQVVGNNVTQVVGNNVTQAVDNNNYKRLYQSVKQENEWLRDYSNKLMNIIIKQSKDLDSLRSINKGGNNYGE